MSSRQRIVDLYRVLGIGRHATAAEVAAGYKAAVRSAHPDAGGSHEQFLLVDLARRVLSDSWLRARYDSLLAVDDEIEQVRAAAVAGCSPDEIRGLLDRCQAAADVLSGFERLRLPVELEAMVTLLSGDLLAVIDDLRVVASQRTAGAGRSTRGSGSASSAGYGTGSTDSGAFSDDTTSHFDDLRARVAEFMQRQIERLEADLRDYCQARAEALRTTGTVKEQRLRLAKVADLYGVLRRHQDLLSTMRRCGHHEYLADEHRVLTALEDAVDILHRRGEELQRGANTKAASWLREQRRLVEGELRARGMPIPDWRPNAPRADRQRRSRSTDQGRDDRGRDDRSRAGQGRAGQRRSGQRRSGHGRAGRNTPEQPLRNVPATDAPVLVGPSSRAGGQRRTPRAAAGMARLVVVALLIAGGLWVAVRYLAERSGDTERFDAAACVTTIEQVGSTVDNATRLVATLTRLEDACRVPSKAAVDEPTRTTFDGLATLAGQLAVCINERDRPGIAATCGGELRRFVTAAEALAGPIKILDTTLSTDF
jgi:curved DNA-binding protein CbpA